MYHCSIEITSRNMKASLCFAFLTALVALSSAKELKREVTKRYASDIGDHGLSFASPFIRSSLPLNFDTSYSLGLEQLPYSIGANTYGSQQLAYAPFLGYSQHVPLLRASSLDALPLINLGESSRTVITKHVRVPHPVAVPYPVDRAVPVPVERIVQVPVDRPVAVPVDRPVAVPHRVEVPVDRPVPVHVPQPYPVTVERQVPVHVDRAVPVPVRVPVRVNVPVPYKVGVPQPYPVEVPKPVAVPVPQPVVYREQVPVAHPVLYREQVPVAQQVFVREQVPVAQPVLYREALNSFVPSHVRQHHHY